MVVSVDEQFVSPEYMTQEHSKIVVKDDEGHESYVLFPTRTLEEVGLDYVKTHAELKYSKSLELWYVNIPLNDYYNDMERNPEKEIPVKFVGIQDGTGREIYRSDNGKYYLRENFYPRENFAKWYICSKREPSGDDGDEPRPNLVFCHNGQKERVRYDDWNGIAAYSDTFNQSFRG